MGLFSRKHQGTATIRRIWHSPPPGAPWYYWTYMLFDQQGDPVEVRLSKRQAKKMMKRCAEGDIGRLTWKGNSLVDWEPASGDAPVMVGERKRVFLSYSHDQADDAYYIAQVLGTFGLDVWIDRDAMRTGDKLSSKVRKALQASEFVVPLFSPEYFASTWCIHELETAADLGLKIRPIKISDGELYLPPHLQSLYRERLGEPIYLDLRRRDPTARLAELAQQIAND